MQDPRTSPGSLMDSDALTMPSPSYGPTLGPQEVEVEFNCIALQICSACEIELLLPGFSCGSVTLRATLNALKELSKHQMFGTSKEYRGYL